MATFSAANTSDLFFKLIHYHSHEDGSNDDGSSGDDNCKVGFFLTVTMSMVGLYLAVTMTIVKFFLATAMETVGLFLGKAISCS